MKTIEIISNHIYEKRYELYKHLETDYCFYMDTDTVVINDRTDELIEEAEDKFHTHNIGGFQHYITSLLVIKN